MSKLEETVWLNGEMGQAWDKEPALALCLAIEKLIDEAAR